MDILRIFIIVKHARMPAKIPTRIPAKMPVGVHRKIQNVNGVFAAIEQ